MVQHFIDFIKEKWNYFSESKELITDHIKDVPLGINIINPTEEFAVLSQEVGYFITRLFIKNYLTLVFKNAI
jgi:hypothetical protein